jgi:hypothetical protein
MSLGLMLSFSSLLLPFHNVEMFRYDYERSGYSAYFWSFKAAGKSYYSLGEFVSRVGLDQPFYASWIRDIMEAPSYPSFYFDVYWFNFAFGTAVFSEVVMTLFTMQLLTLGTALSSLFIKGRVVRLVPVLSGLGEVVLMLYVIMGDLLKRYHSAFARAGLGFWLAVLAEIAFIVGFAFYAKKGSMKSLPKSALVTNSLICRPRSV